jgi:hypothetical protein
MPRWVLWPKVAVAPVSEAYWPMRISPVVLEACGFWQPASMDKDRTAERMGREDRMRFFMGKTQVHSSKVHGSTVEAVLAVFSDGHPERISISELPAEVKRGPELTVCSWPLQKP